MKHNQIEKVRELICAPKYLQEGESFKEGMSRIADTLKDNDEHFKVCQEILLSQRFLPAGRIQASVGAARETTAFNCFVSDTIEDSMTGIFTRLGEAAQTMRLGGGDGFDFSTLRPKGALIKSLGSTSTGPISFMGVWDAMCETIKSAGHRRGAMMGVMRIDHPDIEEFITCKQKAGFLTNFNISVAITNTFMEAVKNDEYFDLTFPCGSDNVYKTVKARYLWNKIMRNTWDHAEPGVLFIDTINKKNNLWYTETIAATNPCLHGDSLVETVNGRMKIKDIKEPIKVYTMLPDGSLGIRQATAAWKTKKNAKTLVVEVGSGKKLTCTPNHKIYVRGKGWVEAQHLVKGDMLVHLCRARRGVAYSGVKLSTEKNRAYQMEHRFQYEGEWEVSLRDGYDVHHIDGNTYNNTITNLVDMPHSEHSTLTRYEVNNNHQVKGNDGKWISNNSNYTKPVINMPDILRSNLKNQKSACVVSIKDGPVADVYDMTVEETHNFIADFIVVHNCGEQPLPPNGACLLGSFNLTKYVKMNDMEEILRSPDCEDVWFDWEQFIDDIPPIVRMMDNVIDRTVYPLPQQEIEAKNKRRMGLGITGLANAAEFLGYEYGSEEMILFMKNVMSVLRDRAYVASTRLAQEKGSFPAFREVEYLKSEFIKTLPPNIIGRIKEHGIRNSHLLSIAPTGTISLWAGNISSGIEPPFALEYNRKVVMPGVDKTVEEFRVFDYAWSEWGIRGKTSDQVSAKEHIDVLTTASRYVDSACSKTCNVGDAVMFEDFKNLYVAAYEGGASGCTTFRPAGFREGVLTVDKEETNEGAMCVIDPITGEKSCAD